MRGVTRLVELLEVHTVISTRTPHAGSDICRYVVYLLLREFQPALPMRGVTSFPDDAADFIALFQPALPMRGVTKTPNITGRAS